MKMKMDQDPVPGSEQMPVQKAIGLTLVYLVLALAFPSPVRAGEAQAQRLRAAAEALPDAGAPASLLERAAERRAVLLGECTHGTSEFYALRAALTLALVEQHGFRFIAVEGDGDAWHTMRPYLSGAADGPASAADGLRRFERWPTWLWANEETAALVEALRAHNLRQPPERRVFIYGLDLYGAPASIRALLDGIDAQEPGAAAAFADHYRVLLAYGDDWSAYARAVGRGGPPTDGAERALERLTRWLDDRPGLDPAERFRLEHLALGIRDAERHYRAMPRAGPESWNIRADHFFAVFERLLARYGPESRGIAWAHNTHIGDARATPMAAQGQRNMGQTARERLGRDQVLLVGLTAARGRVVASRQWGGASGEKTMPPPRPASLESRLKRTVEHGRFLLWLEGVEPPFFEGTVSHRAIGVLYRPELDYVHNYVPTVLHDRYDALLFFRDTTPLRILPR